MWGKASILKEGHSLAPYSASVSVASAARPKVRIRGLRKVFRVRQRAVEALATVDLDVGSGEFVAIVGPSGCGKTTLLRILAGLETASDGEFSVERAAGRDLPLNSMVFQEQSIFPWMSVRDNVAFGLKARGVARRARPGRIKDQVDIAAIYARPRDVAAVRSSAPYGELFARIWRELRTEIAA